MSCSKGIMNLSTPSKRSSGHSVSTHQREAIGSTSVTVVCTCVRKWEKTYAVFETLPEAAFFSAEEKVQLLSGNCPRNITKERLKEWLSFRKGAAKDGSARFEATKAELAQTAIFVVTYNHCHCLNRISKHTFYIDLFYTCCRVISNNREKTETERRHFR